MHDVIVVGSGNAALCAGIAASERGASVLVIEMAPEDMAGGRTKYTAGAMRFAYRSGEELTALLRDPSDARLSRTDFGAYPEDKSRSDLLFFNDGRPLSAEQQKLVSKSPETLHWLASHDVRFEPIYSRQSFERPVRVLGWPSAGGATRRCRLFRSRARRVPEHGRRKRVRLRRRASPHRKRPGGRRCGPRN